MENNVKQCKTMTNVEKQCKTVKSNYEIDIAHFIDEESLAKKKWKTM